jgi:divalent metal cation (Fe/Co/Zn/Cd) transporter
VHFDTRRPPFGAVLLLLCLVLVTIVLLLQSTKQALLPANETPLVWTAEFAVMIGVLVLRSGWARDSAWAEEQERLGTLANNFYEPRRDWLTSGGAVAGGIFGGLWWGLATWGVMFTGMRRGVAGRALIDFETATAMGAITGGVVGAVIGLAIGHTWEKRHRQRRLARAVGR